MARTDNLENDRRPPQLLRAVALLVTFCVLFVVAYFASLPYLLDAQWPNSNQQSATEVLGRNEFVGLRVIAGQPRLEALMIRWAEDSRGNGIAFKMYFRRLRGRFIDAYE